MADGMTRLHPYKALQTCRRANISVMTDYHDAFNSHNL
jgi:hypothetical protein